MKKTKSYIRHRKILQGLLDLVNSRGEARFFEGLVTDYFGLPITILPYINEYKYNQYLEIKKHAVKLIDIAVNGPEFIAAALKNDGLTAMVILPDKKGPGITIPVATTFEAIPYAILMVALCTPTGAGDNLIDRLSKCGLCGKFFIKKTRKLTKYCSVDHYVKDYTSKLNLRDSKSKCNKSSCSK